MAWRNTSMLEKLRWVKRTMVLLPWIATKPTSSDAITMTPTTTECLLTDRLCPELRAKIYEEVMYVNGIVRWWRESDSVEESYYIKDSDYDEESDRDDDSAESKGDYDEESVDDYAYETMTRRVDISLLLTCSYVHLEALHAFYRVNRFSVGLSEGIGLEAQLGRLETAHLQHLRVYPFDNGPLCGIERHVARELPTIPSRLVALLSPSMPRLKEIVFEYSLDCAAVERSRTILQRFEPENDLFCKNVGAFQLSQSVQPRIILQTLGMEDAWRMAQLVDVSLEQAIAVSKTDTWEGYFEMDLGSWLAIYEDFGLHGLQISEGPNSEDRNALVRLWRLRPWETKEVPLVHPKLPLGVRLIDLDPLVHSLELVEWATDMIWFATGAFDCLLEHGRFDIHTDAETASHW